MPTYAYQCPRCDLIEEDFRKISERDHAIVCPNCSSPTEYMARIPVVPQPPQVGFVPGAIIKDPSTGKSTSVDGLFNKTAPNKKKR